MHAKYNEKTGDLKRCIQKKSKLNLLLKQTEQDIIKEKLFLNKLSDELEKENQDVLKIKSNNVTSLFYAILGTKEDRFKKEKQELLKVKLKYDQCKNNLDFLVNETKKIIDKLTLIDGCDDGHEELADERLKTVNFEDKEDEQELNKLIERKENVTGNLVEIDEAISYGEKALDAIEKSIQALDGTEGWGLMDAAEALVADRRNIDDAREDAEQVQRMLTKFKKKLADITMMTGNEIATGPFETFADCFFDSMIFDWLVQDEIGKTLDTVKNMKNQLDKAMSKLYEEKVTEECMANQIEDKINHIMENS